MMIFAPKAPANESDILCRGVELYEASRPPATPEFRIVHWIFFWLFVLLWFLSLIWFWVARDTPRLRIVRPFSISLHLVNAHFLFCIASLLNLAIPNLPCAVQVFCFLFALAGYSTNYFVRALVFAVESQFALNAGNYVVPLSDDSRSHVSTELWSASRLSALHSVAKVALGLSDIKDVPMADLVVTKHLYGLIALLASLPPTIPFGIIMILVPEYRECSGCAVFLEAPIVYLCVLSLYTMFGIRLMFVAWKLKFPDPQGTLSELKGITFIIAPSTVFLWMMAALDINDLEFNRQFMYEWLWMLIGLEFWVISAGVQMYAQGKQSRALKAAQLGDQVSSSKVLSADTAPSTTHAQTFIAILESEPETRQSFHKYAVEHYCVENLYFVEDVHNYKRFFMEKAETWRRQKVRLLYETYIKLGGPLEVNISYDTKQHLEARLKKLGIAVSKAEQSIISLEDSPQGTTSPLALHDIFDEATEDIARDVLQGVWQQFDMKRANHPHRKSRFGAITNFLPNVDPV